MRGFRKAALIMAIIAFVLSPPPYADAARLKDISHIQGVRENQLIGYGLVVGLLKSGDDQKILYTIQSLTSMLARMGVKVDPAEIRARNVAAVIVTANLPPFSTVGKAIDVTVSSIGNAKSLQGGTLLMTPLKGADGKIYAMAQGPLLVGGYSFSGAGGTAVTKNHPTVARIPDGGIIERTINFNINLREDMVISLIDFDFTTAAHISDSINNFLGGPYAKARDAGAVVLQVPGQYRRRVVELVAQIENLQIQTDRRAKVILNERTGTVVMGSEVRISTIAISHGSLKVQISTQFSVSQPSPLSTKGRTVVVPNTNIQAVEEESRLMLIKEGVTIGQVVMALNSVGVSPRDLIDILQAIKAAGALEADMEII